MGEPHSQFGIPAAALGLMPRLMVKLAPHKRLSGDVWGEQDGVQAAFENNMRRYDTSIFSILLLLRLCLLLMMIEEAGFRGLLGIKIPRISHPSSKLKT